MVIYSKLGYNSIDEYENDFQNTLLETNHTYEYFVNWKKVFSKLEDYRNEINILNQLNTLDSSNIEEEFEKIIKENPKVISIITSLLAIREKNVDVLDVEDGIFKKIKLGKKADNIEEIMDFCKKTGLIDLFNNIDDLYSYLVGLEAGLDSNARKNRSGTIFEDIVGDLLAKKIKNHPQYRLEKEDTIQFERTKRWDYVIYKNNQPKFFFECNFYSGRGSKPIETANAYVDLQKQLTQMDLTFIWVTDGQGWLKMKKSLQEVSSEIEYIVNYKMLSERIDKVIFEE